MDVEQVQLLGQQLKEQIQQVIKGKDEVIDQVLVCLLSEGHLLLEDMPGTGKTTLAKALAKSLDCRFQRVQFTPDLLPSDLTGVNYFNQQEGAFVFKEGAVFTNVLLGDEINRATPRTQSSLLECMEERQVTIDGKTYPLDPPFFVIATQNPIEIQGTFPLPEAQLDRFLMRLSLGYPDRANELDMLSGQQVKHPIEQLQPVIDKATLQQAQKVVKKTFVSDIVKEYLLDLVRETRTHPQIRLGVSPRGSLALLRTAQAKAVLSGRSYVIPDDIKTIFLPVLCHRIRCKGGSLLQSGDVAGNYLSQILVQVNVPTEE